MADNNIVTGDDYENDFDIDTYMSFIYEKPNPTMEKMVEFLMQTFHDVFIDGKIKGHQLLDIGSGPTIHSVISACNNVDEIYLSDYSKRHIDILNKWLRGEKEIQKKQVQLVCELENKGQTVENRVEQMRKKVKGVAFIDITKPNSLTGCDVPKQFDVITSCWCLDSVGQTIEAYRECAENIYALVKPGGYFVLFGNFDCSLFTMDNVKFPLMDISEEQLRKIYEGVGFEILAIKVENITDESVCGDAHFSMTAQRKM